MGVWIETDVTLLNRLSDMSHPVWVCGLKLFGQCQKEVGFGVTPCMGVWIETERFRFRFRDSDVTPCMGVWIETCHHLDVACAVLVTPCMGVWIETFNWYY